MAYHPPIDGSAFKRQSRSGRASYAEGPASTAAPFRLSGSPASVRSSMSSAIPRVDTSRKRPRTSLNVGGATHPRAVVERRSWADLGASSVSLGSASPAPLSNDTYRLAGGIDTPTAAIASQYERLEDDSERDLLKRRWTTSRLQNDRRIVEVGAMERERCGGQRPSTSSNHEPQKQSWSQYIFNVVGNIVGTVLEFSKAGAFKGFKAGQGRGYDMSNAAPQPIDSDELEAIEASYHASSMPGQYPGALEDLDMEADDQRPAKRRQRPSGEGWIMVDNPSQSRLWDKSTYSNASPSGRRRLASHATIRPSHSRRSRVSTTRIMSVSNTGSPQLLHDHKRSASHAPARSPASSPQALQPSPARTAIDEDLQKYSSKRHKESKQSDASMRRLNDQLQAMIKQGKQALASTIEVKDSSKLDDDDIDEGYVEGLEYDKPDHPAAWR